MINAETLTANGYRRYNDNRSPAATALFQKRVTDERGIRYFINVVEYDISVIPNYPGPTLRYEPDVRFYEGDGEDAVNVSIMLDRIKTVQDLESYVLHMWNKMSFGYYELT